MLIHRLSDRLSRKHALRIKAFDVEVRQHIQSSQADGMERLLRRVEAYWGPLERAFAAYAAGNGVDGLAEGCRNFINIVDTIDLFARDAPLRSGINGYDWAVRVAILRSALSTLCDTRGVAMQTVTDDLGARNVAVPRTIVDTMFVLLRAEFALVHGQLEIAESLSREALALDSAAPLAQKLLHATYHEKRKLGLPILADVAMQDLSDKFCAVPFDSFVTAKGDFGVGPELPGVFACTCGGWLPYEISQRDPDATADAVWNGPAVQEIRRSILDGDFSYCSRTLCPYLLQDSLPDKDAVTNTRHRSIIDERRLVIPEGPKLMSLCHDPSCNLSCPSCRADFILAKSDDRKKLDAFSERLILPLLDQMDGELFVTGFGDPFGSKHYRQFLRQLNPTKHKGVTLNLLTNGLLLTPKEWDDLGSVTDMISEISVSIDAAQADTYENVRRPGKWSVLTSNMTFIGALRKQGAFQILSVNFVVQSANFREMPTFVELALGWNVDVIKFQKLWNFGPYSQERFEENDVSDPRHPDHAEYQKILESQLLKNPAVSMFNVT
jgi:hypothetical protein